MPDSLDDHYYRQSQHIATFWQKRQLEKLENLGLKAIDEGNWYPVIYQTLAMLYRKQKRYPEEATVLKIGIERNQKNPGVAKHDFAKRLIRVQQLIESSKLR